jgi:hypothetical protein
LEEFPDYRGGGGRATLELISAFPVNSWSLQMNRRGQDDDRRTERKRTEEPKNRSKDEGDIEHIVDTGLPPGIEVEDAIDPGNAPKSRSRTQKT